ncbi:Dnaj Subfamily C Member 5G [Manis pentadactyla]|nr:Dnaj Subfamily C Member 5G [Manis pentadactyla]
MMGLTRESFAEEVMSHVDEAAHQLSKSGITLYAVLELKKGTSPEDIKKAYRHWCSCVRCSPAAAAASVAACAVGSSGHPSRRLQAGCACSTPGDSLQGQTPKFRSIDGVYPPTPPPL